jgi:hypothetical protein
MLIDNNTGNSLIMRGTQTVKTSSALGLKFALPIGIIGLGAANILQRVYLNKNITFVYKIRTQNLFHMFTFPTILSVAGILVGMSSIFIGTGISILVKILNQDLIIDKLVPPTSRRGYF